MLVLLDLDKIVEYTLKCKDEFQYWRIAIIKIMSRLLQDYGMWERGDKTNQGIPELNASSVGMAKVQKLHVI